MVKLFFIICLISSDPYSISCKEGVLYPAFMTTKECKESGEAILGRLQGLLPKWKVMAAKCDFNPNEGDI